MKCTLRTLIAGVLLSVSAGTVLAQQPYPSRTITIIVAFGPAGVTDSLNRIVAKHLSERFKVPVIVENRPGANQLVGIQQLKSRPADGYTLYAGTGSALVQNPGVRKDLPYDPAKDFQPIALLGVQAGVIGAAPTLPAKNLKDFVEYVKANPDKLNYASQGIGSAGHLSMEYFMSRTSTKMAHIPFKSDSEVSAELMSGRVDVAFMTTQFALPLAQAGKLRILSSSSVKPLAFLPGIPSLSEAGVSGLEGLDPFTFYALVSLAGTPPEAVKLLNESVNSVIRLPEIAAQMRDVFRVEPRPGTPDDFRAFLQDELAKWKEIGTRVKVDTR